MVAVVRAAPSGAVVCGEEGVVMVVKREATAFEVVAEAMGATAVATADPQ